MPPVEKHPVQNIFCCEHVQHDAHVHDRLDTKQHSLAYVFLSLKVRRRFMTRYLRPREMLFVVCLRDQAVRC